MSRANQLLKEVLEQDNLCATLRAKIQIFLDPESNGYKTWKEGDRLRVIDRESTDFFQIGEIVTHDDDAGEMTPFCLSLDGLKWYAIAANKLEFVERPE